MSEGRSEGRNLLGGVKEGMSEERSKGVEEGMKEPSGRSGERKE